MMAIHAITLERSLQIIKLEVQSRVVERILFMLKVFCASRETDCPVQDE